MKNKLNVLIIALGFTLSLHSMSHDSSRNGLDWSIEQVNKTREETVIAFLVKIHDRIKKLYNIPRIMGEERSKELFRQRVEFIKDELNLLIELNPILNMIDSNLLDAIIIVYSKVSNLEFQIKKDCDNLYLSVKLLNIIISDMSGEEFSVEEFNPEDPSYGNSKLEYI